MIALWTHVAPTLLSSFFASLVEFVEALTVVLAVAATRGWRSAIIGSAAGLSALGLLTLAFGSQLGRLPLAAIQVTVGTLIVLFGLRWLRKAVLRSAGAIALHDEAAIYAKEVGRLAAPEARKSAFDAAGFATAFKITMIEGIEVVFIVLALGVGDRALLEPAILGALAALVLVIALGALLHRPLSRLPENGLKFLVGLLLTAFGTFWIGEGLGVEWPDGDLALLFLAAGYLAAAGAAVIAARAQLRASPLRVGEGGL
ncbi:COG4280 domain-containing protein [Sphingobium estronivorans]|uniref:COG4280 domain-containing protein n=1 Tax=Sphingobium estronivorans TaxID=1577690 RepID=UPI0012391876|nr:hypothetical protein [Sphingobium estronivorans]